MEASPFAEKEESENDRYLSAVLSLAIAMMLVLTACGGSSAADSSFTSIQSAPAASAPMESFSSANGMYMASDMAEEAVMEKEKSAPDAGAGESTVPSELEQERKIIKNCWMDLETTAFDTALDSLTQLIQDAGGYIESQSLGGRSLNDQGDYYERSASVTARIPAEKLDEVTAAVGETFNIVSSNESIQDITDSYYDAQTRLDNMKLQEQRLQELLAQAQSLEDIITLESALADVRSEIESLTGRLRRMDSQVAYSTLTMEIHEVVELTQLQQKPKTFGEKLGESFRRSGENITRTLQGMIFFLVEDGPVLVIWALLILLIVVIVRSIVRRYRKNHPPRQPFSLVPPAGTSGVRPPAPPTSSDSSKEQKPEER